jgi:alpha-1,2-mannosyltransferase
MQPNSIKELHRWVYIGFWPSFILLFSLFMPVEGLVDRMGHAIGRDFINFWMAGYLTVEGRLSELYQFDRYMATLRELVAPKSPFMNFSYFPNALPLLAPLGLLSFPAGLALWSIGGLAAFMTAATGRFPFSRPIDWKSLRLLLAAPATLLSLAMGQAGLLLAGLFVGGFRCYATMPRRAGVLFGLLSVKPQIAVIIPIILIAQGRWLVLAYAALTALALLWLSVALFGVSPWLAYMGQTLEFQTQFLALEHGRGLAVALLITPYSFLRALELAKLEAIAVHGAISLAVVMGVIATVRRGISAAETALVATLASMILSPYCLAYDLVIPTAALYWYLSERTGPLSTTERFLIGSFVAMPVIAFLSAAYGAPFMPPVIVALLVACLLRLKSETPVGRPVVGSA